ncbi:circadian clock KaiB family protein [Spirulina sp. CS-785/01]|uniref:circadian clock KaiB family protein n=1 Tax=Spirulina sp. CS-785/01 TaxID=3021716 RepID=UPI00232CC229|nr:circadian clock KaiB family protein [Spirulina sp. CS-785/01]MDB9314324.1 circadian clock KaiB family protein [Spirulina sp. CS-785/01]
MSSQSPTLPSLFKGIALFTPAGDVIYGIDPSKQGRWHTHLCVGLQELLGLAEPPHFLIPGYTATIDRWLDPKTQEVRTLTEVYPAVRRYQPLLNTIFGTPDLDWRLATWQEQSCDPLVIESYRSQFPQLWQEHDFVVSYDQLQAHNQSLTEDQPLSHPLTVTEHPPNYVLRLFVSGDNATTEKTLKSIHQLLETGLNFPYTLKVIDIFKHPDQAEANHVSATPTLVRAYPQPVRRIIGELNDTQRVLKIITTG